MTSLFIPHEALSLLVDLKRAELANDVLVLAAGKLRLQTEEGARILAEVLDGAPDDPLVGKACSNEHLVVELGGEILGESLLIEDRAYDIVPGFVCQAIDGPLKAADRELLVGLQDELS